MILLDKRKPQPRGYLISAYKEHPGHLSVWSVSPLVKTVLIQVEVRTWEREVPLVKVNYVRPKVSLEDLHTATQMIMDDVKYGE